MADDVVFCHMKMCMLFVDIGVAEISYSILISGVRVICKVFSVPHMLLLLLYLVLLLLLHPFNGPLSGTIRMSRYQKGKTNLDLLEQDSEWQ